MATVAAPVVVVPKRASRGLWRDAFTRLRRNRPALVGMSFIALFVFVAVFAPLLAAFDPNKTGLGRTLQPPSPQHLAGLDKLGRDELSRVIYGARISLFTGVVSVIIGLAALWYFTSGETPGDSGVLGPRYAPEADDREDPSHRQVTEEELLRALTTEAQRRAEPQPEPEADYEE